MTPAQLFRNIRSPPADSMIGHMTRTDGKVMRTMPWVMLINLVWLFLWPMMAHQPFSTVILPTLLSVPLFLYLYLCGYFYCGPHRERLRYILAMMSLAYLFAPFNVSVMGYLIFGYFSMVFAMSVRTAWIVVLGSVAAFGLEVYLLGHNRETIIGVTTPALVLGIIAIFTCYAHNQQMALRHGQEEILRLATLAERERIGRDLHDLLGHTLSVVALKSELARKLIDRDLGAARGEIQEVERVARDALSQVRHAVAGIRSTALAAELVAATALLEAQGVKVSCDAEDVQLSHLCETALALSLREAATNIRRHSGATGVSIRVKRESAAVVMEVTDDGRGGRIVPGNGLNGMRERLDNVGGTLSLAPNKDRGTSLRASVPAAA